MPVMSLPCSMTTAPSLTRTSPSPPKLVAFQPTRDFPSKRLFHSIFSFLSPVGAFLPDSPAPPFHAGRARHRQRAVTRRLVVMVRSLSQWPKKLDRAVAGAILPRRAAAATVG